MSNQTDLNDAAIACNFGAIDPANRNDHADTAESIFASTLEIKALADGYGFRLPLDDAMLHRVSAWIANERRCCPFFAFGVSVGAELWLTLTGTDEVKAYIASSIVEPLRVSGTLPDKAQWIADHTPAE